MTVHRRPTKDSLEPVVCGDPWCGRKADSPGSHEVNVTLPGHALAFCSPGCASRWLITYELHHDAAQPEFPAPPPAAPRRPRPAPTLIGGALPSEVRDWARSHGHQVADRARIPGHIRDAYLEAHPEEAGQ